VPTKALSTQTENPETHISTWLGSAGHTVVPSVGQNDGSVTGRGVPGSWTGACEITGTILGRGVGVGTVEQALQVAPRASSALTSVASIHMVNPATHMSTLDGSPGHSVDASTGQDERAATGRNVPAPGNWIGGGVVAGTGIDMGVDTGNGVASIWGVVGVSLGAEVPSVKTSVGALDCSDDATGAMVLVGAGGKLLPLGMSGIGISTGTMMDGRAVRSVSSIHVGRSV
jgi:hypothetical protein